jgi:hypothetical protein
MKKQTEQKNAKSVSITLRANGGVMVLLATRREDGSAVSTVTTKNPGDAKATRGMTQEFKSIDAARVHLEALAKSAIALGWKRGTFSAKRPDDAFSKLPAAPKAAPVQSEV